MKNVLLLSALLVSALALPNGFYHQESSSRSSSSSYKNNELQHQTEDESHFSKRGDIEGRVDPKIKTYSQHLEYQNPDRQQHGQSTSFGTGNQNAFRHLDNTDRYTAEQALGRDGIVKTVSGHTGDRNQYAYTATYGVSGGEEVPLRGGQYDTQSNLLSLTQRLQNDLSRQLNSVITKQRRYDTHGSNSYVASEFRDLERDLKLNLTRQLQEELQRQYGTQSSRGSHSYSVKSGRYATQANYNTQELDDLTAQVESNLMQQLRNQYQNTQSTSSNNYYASQTSQNAGGQGSRAHTTMYRPYQEPFPLSPEVRPSTPLTEVVSQVQNTVDRTLNDALAQLEQQYLREDITYTNSPNYDTILENLRHELLRNLTASLDTTLARYYGTQEQHNNYYYTSSNVASGSRVANYKTDDLNSLKQQVENNLLNKINNSIKHQKQTYQTMKRNYSSSQTSSQSQSNTYSNSYQGLPGQVYPSYPTFTPVGAPDTVHDQSNSHNTENSYNTRDEQLNIRPAYRPNTPRYDTRQPSTHNTNYGSGSSYQSNQNQENQRVEQLEYGYSPTSSNGPTGTGPTQVSQSPQRGSNYPTGNYYPSSGSTNYPSSSGTNYPYTNGKNYPSTSGSTYPSTSGTNYPSSGVSNYPSSTSNSNYQTNYRTSQANSESSYQHLAGQSQSGTDYASGSSRPQTEYQAELINIRDQVQNDISRQVSSAIERQRQSGTSYSSSTVSNNQVLAALSEELKRNLTQKIEQTLNEHHGRKGVRGGYSFTVSSGGTINPDNYDSNQLRTLTNQLQEDLLRQLREGLAQESYQHSTSHGRLSSSYRPVVSHGTYGQGSNSYRGYSSGYNGVYSSGTEQGECCMQADDATTTQNMINQHNAGPARGDIGTANKSTKKTEDVNAEDTTQQKTENIESVLEQENESADLEVVPVEDAESTTPGLARNKPSKRPTTVTPTRQNPKQSTVEQEASRSKASTITQDLINSEKYNDYQQQTEDLHVDQQNLEQTHIGSFDQQNMDNFDQKAIDQFNQQLNNFDQHAWGNSDEENSFITQQSLNQHEQTLEDGTIQHGGIIQQNTHNENVQTKPLSSNTDIQRGSISQSLNLDTAAHNTHTSQQAQDSSQYYRNLNHRSRYQPSSISQTTYASQHPEDLSQQTEDLTQQTEDLTQQTEDLTQQTEDLSQHNLYTAAHNTHTSQQAQDSSQYYINLNQRTRYRPSSISQTTYASQHPEDLSQQTEDLTQQTEDLTQQTEDLTQQTEDLSQHTDDMAQQTEDLAQHTEDMTQQTQNLHQQLEGNMRRNFSRGYIGYNPDVPSERLYSSQQNQHMSQQTEDMDQHVESIYQNGRDSHNGQNSQNSYQSFSSQASSAYSSSASSESRHLHYGTISQVPIHTTSDLEPQHLEKQYANRDESEQKLVEVELLPATTTAAPGFWKKIGGKISNTYHKAKDSISSLG